MENESKVPVREYTDIVDVNEKRERTQVNDLYEQNEIKLRRQT